MSKFSDLNLFIMGPIITSFGEVVKRHGVFFHFLLLAFLSVLYIYILFYSIPQFSREEISFSFFLCSTNYREVLKVKMHRFQAYQ